MVEQVGKTMSHPTKIDWASHVWNPVTGCTKVSQGCKHCYAETIANRFWGDRKFTDVQVHEDRIGEPLRWRKPRPRVFVNSMSDLFHEDVDDKDLYDILNVIVDTPHSKFLVLTKRPERMRLVMNERVLPMPPNLWLGVSVENQETADERIPLLLQTPAAVRFLSCEPLLGPVDLGPTWMDRDRYGAGAFDGSSTLDWVICGGESGPHARPMDPDWARYIRDQCAHAKVPFFMKQMARKGNIPEDLLIREFPK